jgi:NitT/TauT family transport system permease protein
VLPASLPAILSAARVSIGLAFAALYLAETFVAATYGIGKYIKVAFDLNGYTRMTARILAMGLLGFSFYIALDVLERILCRWRFRR